MSEDKKIKERFFRDLATGKKFMEPLHQKMDAYYDMYRNRWEQAEGIKISDLYTYVETIVPILTSNRVRGTVKAEFPDYVKHAEGMGYILDHTFDTNNWDYKAQKVARMAEIQRASLAYTGYDPDANNKTGKLTITEINARWCYIDPAVTELEDSSFFIYIEPMRISKVAKMYPDKANDIRDRKSEDSFTGEGKSNWFRNLFKAFSNSLSVFRENTMTRYGESLLPEMDEAEKRKNSIAFVHFWYRDEDTDEWRVAYFADDVLLEDTENPFWHGKLPYDIYCPTEDILSAVGIPMAEHIEKLNEEKNTLLDTIVRHGKKSVDPPMMYNSTMGIKDPRDLQDKTDSGLIPIANPDYIPFQSIAQYMLPAPMPAYMNNLPDQFDVIADRITGVNDSFRGMSEATSGKETQLKQEASYTRIKTKVDNFEKFTKSISEKIIVNAMQFLNTSSAFRVKGDYTKFEQMNTDETPFEVEPIVQGIDPATKEPIHDRQEFFLYANPNEWTQIEGEQAAEGEEGAQNAYRILQMTVEVEAGSSLPTSPMARKEEAMELFSATAIDQTALLEAYDYPKRDEIIKRMQEQQQMQMQAELEAQMMQQAPPLGGSVAPATGTSAQAPDAVGQSLEYIKRSVPELAGMSDEEILALLAQMQQQA